MESLVSGMARKTEAEAVYTRERRRMNRERFRAYRAEFYAACDEGNYRRIREVVQDATLISGETARLIRQMAGIHARRHALASGGGFSGTPLSPSTAVGLRAIDADWVADSRDRR